jgi:hypothetical protein
MSKEKIRPGLTDSENLFARSESSEETWHQDVVLYVVRQSGRALFEPFGDHNPGNCW